MSSSIYSNFARIKEGAIGTKLQQWTGSGLSFVDNVYLADGIAQHFDITDTTVRPIVMRDSLIVSKAGLVESHELEGAILRDVIKCT
jgi:hypothetical protein